MERLLRRAAADDAEALSLVAGATFLEAYAGFMNRDDMQAHLASKSSPERFRAWIADTRAIVTIAETPGSRAPIGYTLLTDPDLPVDRRDGDIELLRIYTLATTWGSGLGADLMARALDDARAGRCRRMLLGVHPENQRAHRFYERHGFRVIGRRTFMVGNSLFDDPIYAIDLDA